MPRDILGDEAILEMLVVLNDPVVNEGDLAGLVKVGMGVRIGRWTVRGPACVADADITLRRLFGDDAGEIVDAAGFFA